MSFYRYLVTTFSSIIFLPAFLAFPESASAQTKLSGEYSAENLTSRNLISRNLTSQNLTSQNLTLVAETSPKAKLFVQSPNSTGDLPPRNEVNQSSETEANESTETKNTQSPETEVNQTVTPKVDPSIEAEVGQPSKPSQNKSPETGVTQSPQPDVNKSSATEVNQSPSSEDTALKEVMAEFDALPGEVSFLVKEGEATLVQLNSTEPLAVASAFKLAILKILKSEIDLNKRSWNNIVTIQSDWKSLPSGILHGWEDGSPLTLKSLATLMISVSDNTATDTLINLLGRQTIELTSPRNRPFLTTRELFVLKSPQNRMLLNRYRQATETQRQSLLPEIAKLPLPTISEFEGVDPVAIDVEWFFSAQELCGIMAEVGHLSLMGINPGMVNPKDWEKVAFKGGSEPGVLNLTSWLQGKNGKSYCVVATWNNKDAPLEQSKFSKLYKGVLSVLANRK
ncbi:serine hydrolase [Mastigocoleus testarum]|uniref:Beta-lactamase class A catalytic domain-containing protein n=1 Tax=Mastigocoleus testarum BC008 TaxID=371196 RepID=A0A0V7ZY60_9CYAN|nr:serine hydrolase [Mastigocoleus testarum]KST69502.1 hypothetical protein BC008_04170 [Mastigocoleus testarum BC008]KST69532.1 hypothetical protein BC008_04320 [Mastigocoleus testarum BC008]